MEFQNTSIVSSASPDLKIPTSSSSGGGTDCGHGSHPSVVVRVQIEEPPTSYELFCHGVRNAYSSQLTSPISSSSSSSTRRGGGGGQNGHGGLGLGGIGFFKTPEMLKAIICDDSGGDIGNASNNESSSSGSGGGQHDVMGSARTRRPRARSAHTRTESRRRRRSSSVSALLDQSFTGMSLGEARTPGAGSTIFQPAKPKLIRRHI